MVAPLTSLPTLAYRMDSTPRPHMLVPMVDAARAENPMKYDTAEMTIVS